MKPKETQHYRLSLEKAKQDYRDGIITATGLVYYTVGIYRKPGQKLRVCDIDVFCKEMGISRAAFYKAISKLKVKGRLNWEAVAGLDLWIPASNVVEIQSGQEVSTNVETLSTNVETLSTNVETLSTNVETLSTNVETLSTNVDEREPEPSDCKGSGTPSYTSQILTNTSHLQEEVEGATEREQEEFLRQLRELRINPDDVSWAIKKFSAATIEDAIAYTKQQTWADKPAAAFVKACKEGLKPESDADIKTAATPLEICRQYYKLSPPMGLKLAAQYGIDEQLLKEEQ
ncbi:MULTISPECIES: hypothetical protein [Cyanophyceae]|uniref:hypothetical protein n=1 Tax=Cyanophyceae TaxID=3028117 RepID=UPI00168331A6|nr:hypothetical protein [Trichocoleus sp. FACHB-40]MBD2006476.1 hypothetical protein [Trichocoleus sp. FACHB-40]